LVVNLAILLSAAALDNWSTISATEYRTTALADGLAGGEDWYSTPMEKSGIITTDQPSTVSTELRYRMYLSTPPASYGA
jgi:hypothetical protein